MVQRIAAVALLAMIGYTAKAQVTQGSFLAGGSLSFSSEKYSEGGTAKNRLTIAPNAGYFFIDKLAGGLKTSFSSYKADGDSYTNFAAGPFARYYFLPVEKKTNVLLEGSFLFGSEKYDGFEAEGKTQIGIAAGPAFFLNQFVAVEALLGWQSVKHKDDAGRYNNFGLSIGFQVHLSGKKKMK